MRKSVGKILRKCHLNSKYKGYLYIQDSVDIIISCIENDKTTYITKDIYPVIAHRYWNYWSKKLFKKMAKRIWIQRTSFLLCHREIWLE